MSNFTFKLSVLYSFRSILLFSSRFLQSCLSNEFLCSSLPNFSIAFLFLALYLCLELLEQLLSEESLLLLCGEQKRDERLPMLLWFRSAFERLLPHPGTSFVLLLQLSGLSLLSGEKECDGSEYALLLSGFVFDTVRTIRKVYWYKWMLNNKFKFNNSSYLLLVTCYLYGS